MPEKRKRERRSGERRREWERDLYVVYGDVAGFTRAGQLLNAEDPLHADARLREFVDIRKDPLVQEILRHGGLHDDCGDAEIGVFGATKKNEDDGRRALFTAYY